ncbi:MAG: PilZ domain-containing protein [Chloroflexota bacterium]
MDKYNHQLILSTFAEKMDQIEKVSLITIYKNIPFSFDAFILNSDKDIVLFKVHKYQLAASILVKDIYIQCDLFEEHIKAKVVKMNPVKLTIGLTDFAYSGDLRRRSSIRVEPDTSLIAYLQIQDTSVVAEIVDISVNGLTVYIDPLYLFSPEITPGKLSSKFEVRLKLPGEEIQSVHAKCAMRDVRKENLSGRYRIGLQLYPDKVIKEVLDRYVSSQQSRVLQEIKMLYERSLAGGENR